MGYGAEDSLVGADVWAGPGGEKPIWVLRDGRSEGLEGRVLGAGVLGRRWAWWGGFNWVDVDANAAPDSDEGAQWGGHWGVGGEDGHDYG